MPCTSTDDLDESFEAYMRGRPLQIRLAPLDTDYSLVRYRKLGRMGILSKRIVDLLFPQAALSGDSRQRYATCASKQDRSNDWRLDTDTDGRAEFIRHLQQQRE
jgi:hypothetical protein